MSEEAELLLTLDELKTASERAARTVALGFARDIVKELKRGHIKLKYGKGEVDVRMDREAAGTFKEWAPELREFFPTEASIDYYAHGMKSNPLYHVRVKWPVMGFDGPIVREKKVDLSEFPITLDKLQALSRQELVALARSAAAGIAGQIKEGRFAKDEANGVYTGTVSRDDHDEMWRDLIKQFLPPCVDVSADVVKRSSGMYHRSKPVFKFSWPIELASPGV